MAEECAQVVREGNVNQGLENRTSMVRIDGLNDELMSCVCHDCD
jgi:hypothetical protein